MHKTAFGGFQVLRATFRIVQSENSEAVEVFALCEIHLICLCFEGISCSCELSSKEDGIS